jgi:ribosome biogenesis GTPase / thiamine phosphate phosphatase
LPCIVSKTYFCKNISEVKQGLVIKTTGSWFTIEDINGELYECKVKGNFRLKDIKSTNPVAVGDRVNFTIQSDQKNAAVKTGWITSIEDRKNYIVRRSPNLSKQSHIIAANIDQAVLVSTVTEPVTTTTFIDRYLASAEAYRIPVLLVFNKTDIYTQEDLHQMNLLLSIYSGIGYKCLATSALKNSGIEEFKNELAFKTNVVNGHSGVGKSTLINTIQPGLNLKTKEISGMHRTGKHTTAFSAMYKLSLGGYIIDTPGIKGFGMLNMEPWEISHYFPEIFKISKKCQYKNCSHTHEPECAVKEAVEEGKVAKSRYISYLGLLEGDEKYRKPY